MGDLAATKDDHDRRVAARGRNYTDGPIRLRARSVFQEPIDRPSLMDWLLRAARG